MTLIDTHAHISYEDYSDRIEEVIQAAEDNGVEKIISIGVDLSSSEAVSYTHLRAHET